MRQRVFILVSCAMVLALCPAATSSTGAQQAAPIVTQGGVGVSEMGQCVQIEVAARGDNCGNPASMRIKVRNVCDQPMDLRFCMENVGGAGWNCGGFNGAQPWDSAASLVSRETTYFTCSTTGRIFRAARPTGRYDIRIPSPPPAGTR